MMRIFLEIAKRARINALSVEMPGPRLPGRVRKIVDGAAIGRISFSRAVGMVACCGVICAAFFAVTLTHAQIGPEVFDVISVKPNRAANSYFNFHDSSPGTLTVTNGSVKDLIEYAYEVRAPQIEGAPAWVGAEKFDVDAKVDDSIAAQERSLPRDQENQLMRARVQSLLADRFKLQLRHETKDMPVLALVVAKEGPKLVEGTGAPVSADSPPPGSLTMRVNAGQWNLASNGAPIQTLIQVMSGQPEIAGRMLVDQTGLTGAYVYKLQWTAQNLSASGAGASDASGPTLFTALQEQLGLRLESTKAPVDVLVVDHVEEPTAN